MTEKTKDFLQKLKDSGNWNNEYDYSKVDYKNIDSKIVIIDENNFEHLVSPYKLLNGCKLTTLSVINKTKYFINKAQSIHGNMYDYNLVNYKLSNKKVIIVCSKHGEFQQTPNKHLMSQGCPECSGLLKLNNEKFLQKLKDSGNWNNEYDYSKVNYINYKNKIIIIDEDGFEHLLSPSDLLIKQSQLNITNVINKNDYFKVKLNKIYGNDVDYSLVNYITAKEKILLFNKPTNTYHLLSPNNILFGKSTLCFSNAINKTEFFKGKGKIIHNNLYDYSRSDFVNSKTPLSIICSKHGEFFQDPNSHLMGSGCFKCSGTIKLTTENFIKRASEIHKNLYDYSEVNYINISEKITIICKIHGSFKQSPDKHIGSGQGCPICNHGYNKKFKLNLLAKLEYTDLLSMDPFEIYTIIGQGKLPSEFGTLAHTDAFSNERVVTIQELKERFNSEEDESEEIIVEEIEDEPIDGVDVEITDISVQKSEITRELSLPNVREINDLHSLDNQIYASMDKEAFEALVQYKLRKLWNSVLNNEISLETLKNESGGQYFETIKELFFIEYEWAMNYQPKEGYSFQHQPNLMQKLTVQRLLKAKAYGNWSGTGAGKTLSFIIASREIEAKLTVIIALNSTIKQTCKVIKEVYPDSVTFTDYKDGQIFDRNKNNYLVLNYEKFQQKKSEELFQSLTNNNQVDFVVIDEVHNAKQRDEGDENESLRRGVLNRLMGRIRENNSELYTLIMSATPVINNLYEAKSLLSLMTGLEYDDINTRRTLPNALKIFQQLILHGLRYIPKYDIEMTELTGGNMSNLNIDGSHLLSKLLSSTSNNYINTEKLLLEDKLKAIQPYLRKGVVIYSYLTTGFIKSIEEYVRSLGYSTGTYTGEEATYIRENNLTKFIAGDIDILIGSKPIGTGVDGLQSVCNRMVIITLPWTDSEYTQLKGRVYRQGSIFGDVEIIIPQVRINFDNDIWSWDVQRLNLIKNKKTLADAALDGIVPSRILPSRETMHKKSQESLQKWKERINDGNIIENKREGVNIELFPSIVDNKERERRLNSELSEFNRRGKTTRSETMHKEFNDNPESWFRYHKLRNERMNQWDEVPYEYIATKIKNRTHKVIDFGCGENLFKDCIPNNEVISLDHIAIDESVIACDMKDISKYVADESVDVAVFSLALWGTNYKDYIVEAHRVLNYGGVIHIGEPIKNYETSEDEESLIKMVQESGFKLVGGIERRDKFIYLIGLKI